MKKTWPSFADDEIAAAVRVLRSGKVNAWTGHEVEQFEKEFADYTGAGYAVAFANGSLALEAAYTCTAQKGYLIREAIIPSRTFVATAMAAVRSGLTPVFCDVEDDGLASWSNVNEVKSPRTSVIAAVHLGGRVSEARHGCVIEDCAQALGARVDGKHVGTFGKVGVFSFCQDKIMTTGGEGGMCITDDYILARKLWSWKDHGKNAELAMEKSNGAYKWCHWSIGTNARMTEMQAAIGRVQLEKVDKWVARRHLLAERLYAKLDGCRALRTPSLQDGEACYRYYAYVCDDISYDWNRDRIVSELLKRGVACGSGACPEVYREQAFYDGRTNCHTAKLLGATSIMYKLDHLMTEKQIDLAASHTKNVMARACLRSA